MCAWVFAAVGRMFSVHRHCMPGNESAAPGRGVGLPPGGVVLEL